MSLIPTPPGPMADPTYTLLAQVRRLESEADALRSENLQLRQQLADAESREAARAHPDIHAAIAETEPPSMDGPVPFILAHRLPVFGRLEPTVWKLPPE